MQAAGLCDIDIKRLSNTMLRKTPCLKHLKTNWKNNNNKTKRTQTINNISHGVVIYV